jgi:hypothetical protein
MVSTCFLQTVHSQYSYPPIDRYISKYRSHRTLPAWPPTIHGPSSNPTLPPRPPTQLAHQTGHSPESLFFQGFVPAHTVCSTGRHNGLHPLRIYITFVMAIIITFDLRLPRNMPLCLYASMHFYIHASRPFHLHCPSYYGSFPCTCTVVHCCTHIPVKLVFSCILFSNRMTVLLPSYYSFHTTKSKNASNN